MKLQTDRVLQAALLLVAVLLLAACAGRPTKQQPVSIMAPEQALGEAQLLDMHIRVFAPAPGESLNPRLPGISAQIRDAEARFLPVHLKRTLQQSGHWGAVRVVPIDGDEGELTVSGTILQSDGEILNVAIQAVDSSGREWLDKEYTAVADRNDYTRGDPGKYDAFQDLYNAIANDLARARLVLDTDQLTEIRRVAALRFAADLAPVPFGSYLVERDGKTTLRRLPAQGDPMWARVTTIRERDYLLIDTLNDHYDGFYRDSWEAYNNWRLFRSEEAENLRRVEREAMTRKVIGIGALVGAVALGMAGSSDVRRNTDVLRQLMIVGGVVVAKSGFDKDREKQIHIDALEELAVSFESEVTPLVVDVDGETHRLTGSAEVQYGKWRDLLKRIYRSETGLPDAAD